MKPCPSPLNPEAGRRNPGLDVLRAVAVLLVMGRHIPPPPNDIQGVTRGLILTWNRGGWIGVDLFFVLSGFLIAGLLFREYQKSGALNLKRFFLRRGLKIYPAFLVLLAATLLLEWHRGHPIPRQALLGDLTFLQNYVGTNMFHTWSLAVEEHFYLLLPLALVLLIRGGPTNANPFRRLPLLFLVLAVLILVLRICTAEIEPQFSTNIHLFPTQLRIDSLAFGVLCAYWFHFQPEAFVAIVGPRRLLFAVAGILMLIPAFCFDVAMTPFIYTVGLTIFYLGSGSLVAALVLGDLPGGQITRWVAAVGAYSYSIYLWHAHVFRNVLPFIEAKSHGEIPYLLVLTLDVVGSVAVGIIMAKLVEYPILRLRDRFVPSETKAL